MQIGKNLREHDIGTPGYYSIGSDAYPITVIGYSRYGYIVQHDKFTGDKENGHDYFGTQVWKFERNPHGQIMEVTYKPSRERWSPKGQNVGYVHFGEWYAHQDPSF